MGTVIETERLLIRTAEIADAEVLLQLWTDPRVMTNVDYPKGLDIRLETIQDGIRAQDPASELRSTFRRQRPL